MEHLNQTLFLLLDAAPDASFRVVETARLLAYDLIWVVPAGLVVGWLRGSSATRQALLAATLAGLTGLLINQLIGLLWYHPRPFEIGIGRTLVWHVQDSSFPSDHLTLIWAVAFGLLRRERTRLAGRTLALLGLPVAWARIYLGVHFPLDMLGAALVALGSARLVRGQEQRLIAPLMRLLLPPYRGLFGGLIRRGWVRE
ncbi:MAG TPA: undecaprenyl-diphosphatase [Rhodocyclaceae bacterium]|nr:undecaprenyl-diphosphatase [Rhodocyclaceae bacterium]